MAQVKIPRTFVPTHETAGLPGFPAVDLFATPGTEAVLGFAGLVTRVSGHNPADPPPLGQGGPWGLSAYVLSDRGDVYYCTHLSKVARPGTRIPAGGEVGVIGDYPGNAPGADHVHVGHHRGDSAEAHYQSTVFPADCYLAAGPPPKQKKGGPPPGGWKVVGPWLLDFLHRGHWTHPA